MYLEVDLSDGLCSGRACCKARGTLKAEARGCASSRGRDMGVCPQSWHRGTLAVEAEVWGRTQRHSRGGGGNVGVHLRSRHGVCLRWGSGGMLAVKALGYSCGGGVGHFQADKNCQDENRSSCL